MEFYELFRHTAGEIIVWILVLFFAASYYYLKNYSKFTEEHETVLVPPNPTKPLPPSGSKMKCFRKAAVSADAGVCAKIGRDILKKRGSAVDAAIAAMICNSVVNMQSAGVGGGFLMTIYKKSEGKVYCLNAKETAPLSATDDLYKNDDNLTKKGPLAVGVPGEIKGYLVAHNKFGKLPWKELVQPTIEICEKGYYLSRHQHSSLSWGKINQTEKNLRDWFITKTGNFKKYGSKIYPSGICQFFKILMKNGPEDFYTGELSEMFLKDIEDIGGIITKEDLQYYKAEWQDPVHITLKNGDHFFSSPPPGSGAILALILNILEEYNFTRKNLNLSHAAVTYHRIIEAFKFAFANRSLLGDPNFLDTEKIVKCLTSKETADILRLKIQDNKTFRDPEYYGAEHSANDDHGTSHISVIDENGDAVATSSTVNLYFGAGLTTPRTAILLNSAMDDFSYPHLVNYFALPFSKANRMEPGKRPLSSMAPSILTDNEGNVKIVIGGAGGPRIITATAWVLIRLLWLRDNLKDAIDAARVHHQLFPMIPSYEYGVVDDLVKNLKEKGHKPERENSASIIYALQKEKNVIVGIDDLRKEGGGVFGIEDVTPPSPDWDYNSVFSLQ